MAHRAPHPFYWCQWDKDADGDYLSYADECDSSAGYCPVGREAFIRSLTCYTLNRIQRGVELALLTQNSPGYHGGEFHVEFDDQNFDLDITHLDSTATSDETELAEIWNGLTEAQRCLLVRMWETGG